MLHDNPMIEFKNGIITMDEIDATIPHLIILDDFMNEAKDETDVSKIFTKGSHHKKTSVIFMIQNLFVQGKKTRSISLNTHYLVIFKNPRDRAQFSYLARQMHPKNSAFLEEAYEDATRLFVHRFKASNS